MNVYLTDGSATAFYTAVFLAFKQTDAIITSEKNVQLRLDAQIIHVLPDEEQCERVYNKLKQWDKNAPREIDLMLRHFDPLKETTALEYIRLLAQRKAPVREMLSLPTVLEAVRLQDAVKLETHRFTGFLRFMETAQGVLYAPYSPDNDITDLITPHFIARLKGKQFVIHDTKRKYAVIYDGKEWIGCEAGEAEIYLSQYEKSFETLWKKYYSAVNIASREHVRQMKGYMPVRYWKFMPEKH